MFSTQSNNVPSANANDSVFCLEFINHEALQDLLKYAPHCDIFNDEQKYQINSLSSINYKKNPGNELGMAKIIYRSKPANQLGRVYHEFKGSKGKALQQQSKRVRHILCHKNNGECLYVDIDIVNAHPKIIIQLCKAYNVECGVIEEYVMNREKILQDVMNRHKCNRSQAKKLFIRLLYSGGWQNWFIEFELPVIEPIDFVKDFYKQMRDICQRFYTHTDFSRNIHEANNKKAKHIGKFINPEATCLSYIIAERENLILWNMRRFFMNNGLQVSVLVYDGLMVRNDGSDVSELFDECQEYIKTNTSYEVKLETKPLTTDLDWKGIVDKLKNGVLDESKVKLGDYFSVKALTKISAERPMDEYLMKKYYFEHWVKYSLTNKCYFVKNKYELTQSTKSDVRDMLGMRAVKTKIPKSKNECWTFIDYYMNEDEDVRAYQSICYEPFDPFNEFKDVVAENINKFATYKHNIKPRDKVDKTKDYIPAYLKHMKRFCENNEKVLEYVLSTLAWKVRDPRFNAGVSIVCQSREEGAGKSCLLEPFKKMFGISNVNFHHTLGGYCGRFSKRCGESMITVIDELKQDRSDNPHMEQFYSDITSPRIVVEPKNVMAYEVENCSLIIAFCNKLCLKVNTNSSSSRRFCATIFDDTGIDIKSPEYKQWLLDNIIVFQEDDDALSQLFWYLYDYKKLSKQELRTVPITKGITSLRNVNAKHEQMFIYNYLFVSETYKKENDLNDTTKVPTHVWIDGDDVIVNRTVVDNHFKHEARITGYVKNKILESSRGITDVRKENVRCYKFHLPTIKSSLNFIE